MSKVKIGLALGGGGACGYAHVGVLKVLEKYNIKPDYIAGTSMGSIVGGLYASGLSVKELEEFSLTTKASKFVDIAAFSWFKKGLIKGKKLEKLINKLAPNKHIENFKTPFVAVATDFETGKPYYFKEGEVGIALRTSAAVPGIFRSVEHDGKLLVDGGLVQNTPHDIVKEMGADFIIAVDVFGDYSLQNRPKSIIKTLLNSLALLIHENERHRECHYDAIIKVNTVKDGQRITPIGYNKKAAIEAIKMGEAAAEKEIQKILEQIKLKEGRY